MEAGNTSIEMRNTGQSILDALLRSKSINKGQYQKLVKKYFTRQADPQPWLSCSNALARQNHNILAHQANAVSEGGNRR